MKIRYLFPGLAFAIVCLLSLAALLFAFQSNQATQESLKLIKETNALSKQSQIDIWAVAPTQMVSVDSCIDAKTNLYVLRYQTQNSIVFTNLGGRALSLVGVGFYDTEHAYAVKREADVTNPIGPLGSVEMFPGSSHEVSLVAAYRSAQDAEYSTREQVQQVVSKLKQVQRAFWQFHFSDGTVYRVELKSLWFSAGRTADNADLSAKCETMQG